MEQIDEGGTAKIYVNTKIPGYICKVLKRRGAQKNVSLEREKEYHQKIYDILAHKNIKDLAISVPKIKATPEYWMERIDTTYPLADEDIWHALPLQTQEKYINNINIFLTLLAKESIYLKDVEAYIQADGSISVIDFGQVNNKPTKELNSAGFVPPSVVNRITI